jgi:HK97 family phage major capsid protein
MRLSEFSRPPTAQAFARFALAKSLTTSNEDAIALAERRWASPIVEMALKAVPGSTLDSTWGAVLSAHNIAPEFVELLDRQTLTGRMTGIRRVPFRTLVAVEVTAPAVGWVGETLQKPVVEGDLDTVQIDHATLAVIAVLSRELAMSSTPAAEAAVTRMLVNGVAFAQDEQFLDPSVSAVPDVSPASITNGAATHVSSGATAVDITADLSLLVADLTAGDVHLRSPYWIMRPRSAVSLALLRLTDAGAAGLQLGGIPILTTAASPAGQVTLVDAAEVLLADEGETRVESASHATLTMSGTGSPTFSLWQKNCVGSRIERRISWQRAKDAAAAYLTGCAW